MATPPPTPPSPPKGDSTPDAGNPAGAAPPEVAPKPGRQSARRSTGEASKPAAKRPRATTPKSGKASRAAAKTAGETSSGRRAPAKPRAAARPRPRPAGLSVAAAPARQSVDTSATDPATRSRGGWWRVIAGGLGAIAAGAALLSLRGSTRRKTHQAADDAEGTPPTSPPHLDP